MECSGSKCYDVLTSWEFDDETYCSTYDDPSSLEVLPSQSTVIQPEPSSSERRQSLAETAEMLDSLFAASFSQTKSPETAQQVSSSYEVCPGCPWLLPRPVFVLALGADVADLGNTYTLPARLQQEGTANELAKVMRNRKFESIMDISRLVDGVVTFEHHDDAARFGAMLEEEGHSSVMIAEVDSHKLFRMAGDLQHVVVLMRAGGYLPMPYQLAAALKQQPALDEM